MLSILGSIGERAKSLWRFGALLGAVALVVLIAGCGGTVLDSTGAEEELQASLTKSLKEKVSSVECPSGQKVEPKATFDCTVNLKNGKTETATLEIRNKQADLSVIKLGGEAVRANE